MSSFPETPASGDRDTGSTALSAEATPEQPISLDVRDIAAGVALVVTGEVDLVTTPPLRACVEEQIGQRPDVLVLDLTGLSFLGSSGLAVLVEAREQCRDQGTTLRLVCTSREVLRPMEATGLTELFEIFPDFEAAESAS